MTIFYSVGIASHPDPSDKRYATEAEAIDAAQEMANRFGFHATIAVWADDDEPVYVFVLGEMFKRAT